MESTFYDINTAAEKLDLTPQQVRNLCRLGKLHAERFGRAWMVKAASVEKYYDCNSCGIAEDQVNDWSRETHHERKGPVALSFFSGAMGMDIGLERAGFNTVLACEIDNACRKTILKNKPNITLIGDLLNYSPKEIKQLAGLDKDDDIDLIVGGPPCQAFSTAGKRKGFEDERGNVFLSFIDLITTLRPKYAVIENVRGLLSAPLKHRPHNVRGEDFPPLGMEEQKGGALAYVLQLLHAAGYAVNFNLYNAANFGTPQKRERVIIICSRDGEKPPYLVPTHAENGAHGLPAWRTFREAVKGLEKMEHHHVVFPEKRLRFYRMLGPGQYWKDLPADLQKEALGNAINSGGGKTGFLRRLAWDAPSPTLVTHPAMPATDLAHPVLNRPLSIQEYKRVQEFPDDWQIEGSLLEQYRQVGNAVPVSLGFAIGKLLMGLLEGKRPVFTGDFKFSRYNLTSADEWLAEFEAMAKKQLAMF